MPDERHCAIPQLAGSTTSRYSAFAAAAAMLPASIFPMPSAAVAAAGAFVRAPATHTSSTSSGRYPSSVPGQRVLALSVATAAASPTMHLIARPKESAPERPMLKLVIGAGVAFGYELALGHYLEFIKIMKQTRPGSYVHLTKEIMHSKGVIGIWDGFFPWGAVQAVAKGSVFSWGHALTRQQLEPFVADKRVSTDVAEVIAGGIGGGFQGFVLSPTLLLKTRVMTDPAFRGHMTPLETCKKSLSVGMKVVQNEGVSALMKGSLVFSLKRVVDWSTRFFFSVQSENMLYKREDPHAVLTTPQKMKASMLGGVFSSFLTLPIDVMVAQIQQASKAGAKVSIIDTFRQEFERGGMKQVAGFATTGFTVRLLHVCFTTMIMKTGTSAVYEMYSRSLE